MITVKDTCCTAGMPGRRARQHGKSPILSGLCFVACVSATVAQQNVTNAGVGNSTVASDAALSPPSWTQPTDEYAYYKLREPTDSEYEIVDLKAVFVGSIDECKASCDETTGCNAAAFYTGEWLPEGRNCYLKQLAPKHVCEDGWNFPMMAKYAGGFLQKRSSCDKPAPPAPTPPPPAVAIPFRSSMDVTYDFIRNYDVVPAYHKFQDILQSPGRFVDNMRSCVDVCDSEPECTAASFYTPKDTEPRLPGNRNCWLRRLAPTLQCAPAEVFKPAINGAKGSGILIKRDTFACPPPAPPPRPPPVPVPVAPVTSPSGGGIVQPSTDTVATGGDTVGTRTETGDEVSSGTRAASAAFAGIVSVIAALTCSLLGL